MVVGIVLTWTTEHVSVSFDSEQGLFAGMPTLYFAKSG